jgi:hypothetical protein
MTRCRSFRFRAGLLVVSGLILARRIRAIEVVT